MVLSGEPLEANYILNTSVDNVSQGEPAPKDSKFGGKDGAAFSRIRPLDVIEAGREDMRKGGRRFPVVDEEAYDQVNWRRVEAMLEAGCNSKEIAGAVGLREVTLFEGVQHRFGLIWTDYAERFIEKGKAHLRLTQHEYAKSGNVAMLIHLGKYRLNQRDDPDSAPIVSITVKRKPPAIADSSQTTEPK